MKSGTEQSQRWQTKWLILTTQIKIKLDYIKLNQIPKCTDQIANYIEYTDWARKTHSISNETCTCFSILPFSYRVKSWPTPFTTGLICAQNTPRVNRVTPQPGKHESLREHPVCLQQELMFQLARKHQLAVQLHNSFWDQDSDP